MGAPNYANSAVGAALGGLRCQGRPQASLQRCTVASSAVGLLMFRVIVQAIRHPARFSNRPPTSHEQVLHPNTSCGLSSFCPPSPHSLQVGDALPEPGDLSKGEGGGCVPGQNPLREGAVGIKRHLPNWEHSLQGLTTANRLPWGRGGSGMPPQFLKKSYLAPLVIACHAQRGPSLPRRRLSPGGRSPSRASLSPEGPGCEAAGPPQNWG